MPDNIHEPHSLEDLRQTASRITNQPDDTALAERFRAQLSQVTDRDFLEDLSRRVSPWPEAAIPILERLLQLPGADTTDLSIRIGFAAFTAGDDTSARVWLDRARAAEGESVRVLHLEATLSRDNAHKKKLYTKILFLEPNNRAAWEHILALR